MKQSARPLFVMLAAILVAVLGTQSAAADGGVVYAQSSFCVSANAQSTLNHTTKTISASARTTARLSSSDAHRCDTFDVWTPGTLYVNITLFKWSLKRSQWEVCTAGGSTFNTTWTDQVSVEVMFGAGATYPCWDPTEGATTQRPTYYMTSSNSYVWTGTDWRGGLKYSNIHSAPA